MGTVYNLDEWRATHGPRQTVDQARAAGVSELSIGTGIAKAWLANVPTWVWGAAAVVAVGILAARSSSK